MSNPSAWFAMPSEYQKMQNAPICEAKYQGQKGYTVTSCECDGRTYSPISGATASPVNTPVLSTIRENGGYCTKACETSHPYPQTTIKQKTPNRTSTNTTSPPPVPLHRLLPPPHNTLHAPHHNPLEPSLLHLLHLRPDRHHPPAPYHHPHRHHHATLPNHPPLRQHAKPKHRQPGLRSILHPPRLRRRSDFCLREQ